MRMLSANEAAPDDGKPIVSRLFTEALNNLAQVHEAEVASLTKEISDLRGLGSLGIPCDAVHSPSDSSELTANQATAADAKIESDPKRRSADSDPKHPPSDSDLQPRDSQDELSFEPRPEFNNADSTNKFHLATGRPSSLGSDHSSDVSMFGVSRSVKIAELLDEHPAASDRTSSYVLHPNSRFRFVLDFVTALFLVNDAFAVPYMIAWDPQSPAVTAMWVFMVTFWHLDMLATFFSGFYSEGEPVMDMQLIARRYIRTYFFFDLFVNMTDLVLLSIELALGKQGQQPGLILALRVTRVLRTLRAAILIDRIKENLRAYWLKSKMIMFGLGVKLAVILLWMNHISACFWFFLGKSTSISDTGYTWLDMEMMDGQTYRNATRAYQYWTAFHWAMTQMTPGSIDIVPQSSLERAFNVICLVVGLFAGALLVSQLSAQQMRILNESQQQTKRMQDLRLFLRQNSINWTLRARVNSQIQERLSVQKRLTEHDVELLEVLSITLRTELLRNAFNKYLTTHTIFFMWSQVNYNLIRALCGQAVGFVCIPPGDDLFTPLTVADKMHYVMKGSLSYTLESDIGSQIATQNYFSVSMIMDSLASGRDEIKLVEAGNWISEVVLWMNWSFSGVLEAIDQCELLSISSSALLPLLKKYPKVQRLNFYYCSAFNTLVLKKPRMDFDLTIDCAEVLQVMNLDWRNLVMKHLVQMDSLFDSSELGSFRRWKSVQKLRDELQNELQEGKCILSMGQEGCVQRTVMLCALRLRNSHGEVLVRIAKFNENANHFIPAVALPGTKLLAGESPEKAIQRCLKEDLPQYASIPYRFLKAESATSKSESYGLPTTYRKTIFIASTELDSDNDVEIGGMGISEGDQNTAVGRLSSLDDAPVRSKSKDRFAPNPGRLKFLEKMQVLAIVNHKLDKYLYAWMTDDNFTTLCTPQGTEALESWFGSSNFVISYQALELLCSV